jgi:hypothetical protein
MFRFFSKHLIFLVLFFFAIGFFSCRKEKKLEQLNGSWDCVYLSKNEVHETTTWTFYDGDMLIVDVAADTLISKDTASYSFQYGIFDGSYLTLTNYGFYDGKYKVLKLNKKFLILQRVESPLGGGAFFRFEFVKK